MHGKIKTICIAGKNQCAIDALSYVINNFKSTNILALPNKTDNGKDNWQKSFKKFSKYKKIKITTLKDLYRINDLYFFSLEYENIIDVTKFNSNKLFNLHFSLLPKYRGCHTNFLQIYKGEKKTGVTLHQIDSGIDTGDIIDSISFPINTNCTAYDNYLRLLKQSVVLFKKNFKKIINNKYKLKKQNIQKGSYFNRKSVDYKSLINFDKIDNRLSTHNKIRSLIFYPFQLPIYNGRKIKKSLFKNNKIRILYAK